MKVQRILLVAVKVQLAVRRRLCNARHRLTARILDLHGLGRRALHPLRYERQEHGVTRDVVVLQHVVPQRVGQMRQHQAGMAGKRQDGV